VTALALLLACATTGPGGKRSLILIPTEQELAIGLSMSEQVEQQEAILADTVWRNYVSDVGRKIVAVCDRRDIEYHFRIIESDQVNAFAAPGGYIYFYTGLLRMMENEAELAAVMAHEVSHVVARHSVQRVQAAMGVALAYELAFGDDAGTAINAAVNIGMGLLFAGYSRGNERQADEYGIYYMHQAGYDPRAAVTMFEKLAAAGDSAPSDFFEGMARSHPETQERISNAHAQIAGYQPLRSGLVMNRNRYQKMLARLPAPKSPPDDAGR
jgi:predicted Zn-dependent protease